MSTNEEVSLLWKDVYEILYRVEHRFEEISFDLKEANENLNLSLLVIEKKINEIIMNWINTILKGQIMATIHIAPDILIVQIPLEGRGWMEHAITSFNAKIKDSMDINKFYLHEAYSCVFLEFDTKKDIEKCKKGMCEYDVLWESYLIATIDTNDPEKVKLWESNMSLPNAPGDN